MGIWEILLLALSLSVDSFVVSMGGSVSIGRASAVKTLSVASVFGITQALLLFIGWASGYSIVSYISRIARYIAFIILSYIGGSMIVSAIRKRQEESIDLSGMKHLLLAAVATSIDAMAVGVSLAMSDVGLSDSLTITFAVFSVTFAASSLGIVSGSAAGRKFGTAAQITGGVVLIFIGLKPLLEVCI